MLLDPDSPFLELSPLAAYGTDFTVGASVVAGIGAVSGVECMVVANDPTVKGGTSNPWTLKKILRANQIALENRLPVISLVESGGADLPTQKEIFIPGGQDVPRPDAAVRGGHPDHRAGVRQLHRGRRLHPRHVRPRRDDQGTLEGVPGRATAGEDGHRRGVRRRVARRRRDARPHFGSGRLLRRRRTRRHPDRPPHRRPAELAQTGTRRRDRSPSRCSTPRNCSASCRRICASRSTRAT